MYTHKHTYTPIMEDVGVNGCKDANQHKFMQTTKQTTNSERVTGGRRWSGNAPGPRLEHVCESSDCTGHTHIHTHVLSRRKAVIIPECERRKWSRERGHIQLGCWRQTRQKSWFQFNLKQKSQTNNEEVTWLLRKRQKRIAAVGLNVKTLNQTFRNQI